MRNCPLKHDRKELQHKGITQLKEGSTGFPAYEGADEDSNENQMVTATEHLQLD